MRRIISISAVAYDGYDLPVTLREIGRLGTRYVELAFIKGYSGAFDESVFDEANAGRVAEELAGSGLDILALSAQMDLSTEDAVPYFRRRLEFARAIGARLVITNTGPPARLAQFLRNIVELAEVAQGLGLVIALENPGDGIESIVNDGPSGAAIVRRIGSPAVKLNYDFGNVISHFSNHVRPEEDFVHALPYTAHFHVKDVGASEDGWHFPALGRGIIDYGSILQHLAGLPSRPPLSIEIPTRVSRGADASPRLASTPLPLVEIHSTLRDSLAYVQTQLHDH
jgi:sugar phosphate isomerase/epimerase